MKKRLVKKQIKKVVGLFLGKAVYNFVSNSMYDGGSCVEVYEDCFKCEIFFTRKRYGSPLLLRNRWNHVCDKVHNI